MIFVSSFANFINEVTEVLRARLLSKNLNLLNLQKP